MAFMLGEAAKAIGKNRTTILRAIKTGKLSATHDEATGAWVIEPAELHRLYPPTDAHASAPQGDAHLRIGRASGHASGEIRELRARLDAAEQRVADAQDQIMDLRRRLDAEAVERRRLTALLVDQRPVPPAASPEPASVSPEPAPTRRWWPWRRSR
jgi:hypothetical protein